MLLLKKDTPLYENFPEHQRTHIDKTVREKDVRRTLFCPRIWSASECSYTVDNENPVENKNVGSLLFRGDTVDMPDSGGHRVLHLLSSHSINLTCQTLFTQVSQLRENSYWN